MLNSQDGSFLALNSNTIIERLAPGLQETASSPVNLTAGVKYPLLIGVYSGAGTAVAELSWQGASITKQIIPQTYLFTE